MPPGGVTPRGGGTWRRMQLLRWSRQDPADPRPLRPGDVAVRAESCALTALTRWLIHIINVFDDV